MKKNDPENVSYIKWDGQELKGFNQGMVGSIVNTILTIVF